jgi:DNA mismatch repair ATPase MutS
VTFLHTIRRGVQHNSYGLNVAMLANIPMAIIKRAWYTSRQLQEQTQRRQQRAHFRLLYDTLSKLETSPTKFENNEEMRAKILELIQRIQ